MISELTIEELVAETIPIYTDMNLHPTLGEKDCLTTRTVKKGLRVLMKRELEKDITEDEKKLIVIKYAQKAVLVYGAKVQTES